MRSNAIIAALLVCALAGTCFGGCIEGIFGGDMPVLLMATTTSTDDTGLLDYLKPMFEEEFDCRLVWTAVGTGQALALGERGDADVLLVHSPAKEKAFVSNGYGEYRYQVMYNFFTVLGPESDPAGITAAGATSNATRAFQLIYDAGTAGECQFISRGDESGTHTKEKDIWKNAGYTYATQICTPENAYNMTTGEGWYWSAGAGMGTCLTMASEKQAYIFTDEGTYFSYMANLDLVQLVKNDTKNLNNQYGVIVVNNTRLNPANHTATDANTSYDLAVKFANWIISEEIQQKIAEYAINGRQLFTPNANGIKNP